MSQRHDLTVEARETGKHNSRALRRDRKVPAVVYGATEPTSIMIDESSVIRYNVRAYENSLFNLKSKDAKLNSIVVLLKEVIVSPTFGSNPEAVVNLAKRIGWDNVYFLNELHAKF